METKESPLKKIVPAIKEAGIGENNKVLIGVTKSKDGEIKVRSVAYKDRGYEAQTPTLKLAFLEDVMGKRHLHTWKYDGLAGDFGYYLCSDMDEYGDKNGEYDIYEIWPKNEEGEEHKYQLKKAQESNQSRSSFIVIEEFEKREEAIAYLSKKYKFVQKAGNLKYKWPKLISKRP